MTLARGRSLGRSVDDMVGCPADRHGAGTHRGVLCGAVGLHASAVVNPAASTAGDSFGHGTHVAGLIAGNGTNRSTSDPLYGKYIGVAPDANLIDVKAADEQGNATVLDVIDGL